MGSTAKTVLLVIAILLSLTSMILSYFIMQQALAMMAQFNDGQVHGIEPGAVAGGLKISLIPAILPLTGLVISIVLATKKRKFAGLAFVTNLIALAVCLFLGFGASLWH